MSMDSDIAWLRTELERYPGTLVVEPGLLKYLVGIEQQHNILRGVVEAVLFQLSNGEASDLLDGTIRSQSSAFPDAKADLMRCREQLREALVVPSEGKA